MVLPRKSSFYEGAAPLSKSNLKKLSRYMAETGAESVTIGLISSSPSRTDISKFGSVKVLLLLFGE
jgi:hypothetical protein